eukprot:TRINITY_DN104743_c0_g1_i1.p1 TRINITY_DN104743_c0_g1~~TRINITY_DN104743_c0_g1_i1.p1  ORF type:complete len:538 (-),score=60.85 TRINITY_DN104743_c0_g1_i1:79-1692(-)
MTGYYYDTSSQLSPRLASLGLSPRGGTPPGPPAPPVPAPSSHIGSEVPTAWGHEGPNPLGGQPESCHDLPGGSYPESDVQSLMARVSRAEAAIYDLRCDFQALIDTLWETGTMRKESFEVRLHRQNWERVCQAHPFQCTASLRDVFITRELALACARYTGPMTLGTLSCASALIGQVTSEVLPAVNEMFPLSIYSCGGILAHQAQAQMQRYNPFANVWEGLPPMTQPRFGMSAAVVSGRLYVCGGSVHSNLRLRSAERFDPTEGCWEPVPDMSESRANAAVAVMFRRLYICGGLGEGAQPLNSAECFDPESGHWYTLPHMSCGRCSAVCAVLWGELWVCGGSGDGARRLGSTERLDPNQGIWVRGPPLFEPRSNAAGVVVSGMLYLCGGLGEGAQRLSSVERLDCDARSSQDEHHPHWERVHNMIERRSAAGIAAMGGNLYICGGLGDVGAALSSVERFDPQLGVWESLPSMSYRRWEVPASVVAGKLYVCGGRSSEGSGDALTAERFDPVTNTWERLPDLIAAQSTVVAMHDQLQA